MKKMMITLMALLTLGTATAGVRNVQNERTAMYYLNKGTHPAKLVVRLTGWNGDDSVHSTTKTFKYVKVESDRFGGGAYATKYEANVALQNLVADAKQGIFTSKVLTAIKLECGTLHSSQRFGRNGEFVEELIEMGFLGAGNYRIEPAINSEFEEVFVPGFTLFIPCKY